MCSRGKRRAQALKARKLTLAAAHDVAVNDIAVVLNTIFQFIIPECG